MISKKESHLDVFLDVLSDYKPEPVYLNTRSNFVEMTLEEKAFKTIQNAIFTNYGKNDAVFVEYNNALELAINQVVKETKDEDVKIFYQMIQKENLINEFKQSAFSMDSKNFFSDDFKKLQNVFIDIALQSSKFLNAIRELPPGDTKDCFNYLLGIRSLELEQTTQAEKYMIHALKGISYHLKDAKNSVEQSDMIKTIKRLCEKLSNIYMDKEDSRTALFYSEKKDNITDEVINYRNSNNNFMLTTEQCKKINALVAKNPSNVSLNDMTDFINRDESKKEITIGDE